MQTGIIKNIGLEVVLSSVSLNGHRLTCNS